MQKKYNFDENKFFGVDNISVIGHRNTIFEHFFVHHICTSKYTRMLTIYLDRYISATCWGRIFTWIDIFLPRAGVEYLPG